MNNIILIGFMGVGKGSVARELFKQSDYFAVDTDDLIESLENKRIKDIFKSEGEEYFRALEFKTALWIEKSVNNTIISTGGGFYKVKNICKIGTIIYLKSSFDAILKRIQEHPNAKKKVAKRPLLKDLKKAKEIYKQRVSEYKSIANLTVNVENKSIKKIAREILSQIK